MTERKIVITGGRVIDPSQGIDRVADVWLSDGLVADIQPITQRPAGFEEWRMIDAAGFIVCPGLIDIHCHLGDPGQEDRETIRTGTLAAAHGGFTTVCSMADTDPPVDNRAVVEYIQRTARTIGVVRVCPLAAVTRRLAGSELTDMAELAAAEVVGFSDAERPIANAAVMRHALAYSRLTRRPIAVHGEELTLSAGGVMNEGPVATRLGLKGWPNAAEEVMLARDLTLLELTGGQLHLLHVTTANGVALIRHARQRGLTLTAEATAHHLAMTDEWVAGTRWDGARASPYDTRTKVSPPLRAERDRQALVEAVVDGTIDAIVSDHSPSTSVAKECEFDLASFGLSGLETALGTLLRLVHRGELPLATVVSRLTSDAARVYNLPYGTLKPGSPADVTLIDLDAEWTVDAQSFASLGQNTPLDGQTFRGKAVATIVGGQIVFQDKSWRTALATREASQ